MKKTLSLLLMAAVACLLSYGSYRKGYSTARSRAAAEDAAEYGNDWKGDPAVKHSISWTIGYVHGVSQGTGETRVKDFDECGDKLAEVAIESGSPNIAGKLLAEGYVGPSQLETALSQYNQKHPGNPR
jgi:hypothetical protein